ncbi:hypothetical protein MK079_00960 [Candidatus Gracilibacteria bacterium]|nr:hypothetical protein [Candidatus Gracilibacteria bacterium]
MSTRSNKNTSYTLLQKWVSAGLIFLLFSGMTFQVPLGFSTFATSANFYNLVSIIVSQDEYDSLETEIKRYASDIQAQLPRTKTAIFPFSSDTTAFQIASLNEGLYYGGYESVENVSFQSRLVGTVLIGDIPLPKVYEGDVSVNSVLPYTDFDDKAYVYSHDTQRYEASSENISGISPEVWHGVIAPNTGSDAGDIQAIEDYLDKNHDFYEGDGIFTQTGDILGGNPNEPLENDYTPRVFYFDQFREQASLSYENFSAYEQYLLHKEDIVYKRYTTELAGQIQQALADGKNDILSELAQNAGIDLDFGSISDLNDTPDIASRFVIQNTVKKFLEIFASGIFAGFRENVHNAGRYNGDGSSVNVDLIPSLITILDAVNDQILKEASEDLEGEIDRVVAANLQQNLIIPTKIETYTEYDFSDDNCTIGSRNFLRYTNYLHGKKGSDIASVADCSIYRGSLENGGKLVEANRGLNVNLVQNGAFSCQVGSASFSGDICLGTDQYNGAGTQADIGKDPLGYYGGNSPLNLNTNIFGLPRLKSSNLEGAIFPLFDITGSYENGNSLDVLSPSACLANNYLLSNDPFSFSSFDDDNVIIPGYIHPTLTGALNETYNTWGVLTDNTQQKLDFSLTYEQNIATLGSRDADVNIVYLDGVEVQRSGTSFACEYDVAEYHYKTISSTVSHVSPTQDELEQQAASGITSDLPVDRNRYIEFKNASGNFQKIYYPYLFRLGDPDNLSIANIDTELQNLLATKTSEIGGVDLLAFIQSQTQDFEVLDGLGLSYYDALLFAVYWNNLNSVASKYGFIFENYLSDASLTSTGITLPQTKSQYEIAYIGSDGDAQNMYVSLDPNSKNTHPFADLLAQNAELDSISFGLNIPEFRGYQEPSYGHCAPPNGVPLWEWIPAVVCWLEGLLPPTIGLSDGTCGVNLLSFEEQEFIRSCSGDVNGNGVNDCIETKLNNGSLEVSTDRDKYYYHTTGEIFVTAKDAKGTVVTTDNVTQVDLFITRIVDQLTGETVYDRDNTSLSDTSVIANYIAFENTTIPLQRGVARTAFSVKGQEADIYFESKVDVKDISGLTVVLLESEEHKVEVRGEQLFATSYAITSQSGATQTTLGTSSVEVDNVTNIYFSDQNISDPDDIAASVLSDTSSDEVLLLSLENISKQGNNIPLEYPITVELFDGQENSLQTLTLSQSDLTPWSRGFALQTSGNYTIAIEDSADSKLRKNITLIPDDPTSLDLTLGSTILQGSGAVATHVVTILDQFGNAVSGTTFDLDMEVAGGGLVFEDTNDADVSTSVSEGFRAFRMKSTGTTGTNTLSLTLKDTGGTTLLTTNDTIRVIDDVNVVLIPQSGQPEVGGGVYSYDVSLRDSGGSILTDFDSRVYLSMDSTYGTSTGSFSVMDDGQATVAFTTTNVAGQNIPLSFQIEGVAQVLTQNIDIHPDDPIKLDIVVPSEPIEADGSSSTTVSVELKDQYGNVVFTDNATSLDLDIFEGYTPVISVPTDIVTVSGGVGQFEVFSTTTPGTGYFSVTATPGLESNSFDLGDLTINGVSANAGTIQTAYLWNDTKLSQNGYNALYTTLLGAPYGDITAPDYLAGSLLFDENNRSLAVTSLLHSPYVYDDVVDISPEGNVMNVGVSGDITQDIELAPDISSGNLLLRLRNRALGISFGELAYSFVDSTNLRICTTEADCLGLTNNEIFFIPSTGSGTITGNTLEVRESDGDQVFSVTSTGSFTSFQSPTLEVRSGHSGKELLIDVSLVGTLVGTLGVHLDNTQVRNFRDRTTFDTQKFVLSHTLSLYLATRLYNSRTQIEDEASVVSVFYARPFQDPYRVNEFARSDSSAYENFANNKGLGWGEGNTSLLAFASGQGVGESTRNFASVGMINLGDPVFSLKKKKEFLPGTVTERNFDSTLGKQISGNNTVDGYRVFDYDNDNDDDILLVYRDGYVELQENTLAGFTPLGNLSYIADLGNPELLKTGDFHNDGYADIFFVDNDGQANVLSNNGKDFVRYDISSYSGSGSRIIKTEIFDMDNDGRDDVVTLDEGGIISIWYGDTFSSVPNFVVQVVSDDYGIELDGSTRSSGGVVSFSGLVKPKRVSDPDQLLAQKLAYENASQEEKNSSEANLNINLLNSIIYVDLAVPTTAPTLTGAESIASQIEIPDLPEFGSAGDQSRGALEDFVTTNQAFIDQSRSNALPGGFSSTKTFIKSEYSEAAGIQVKKTYNDLNGGVLQTGDEIEVTVILENVSSSRKNNIVYGEDAGELFRVDESSIVLGEQGEVKDGISEYDFFVDRLNLRAGQATSFTYRTTTLPLQYGHIQVGYFEDGELGDDSFGDILFKQNNQNCGQIVDIFRSQSSRGYARGHTNPQCSEDDLALPDEIAKNAVDLDQNGIPDYIDELYEQATGDPTSSILTDFAQTELNKLNSDIRDEESPLEEIENLIQSLSCGFGGAGCIATPLNWAPLSAGSDPTLFGRPIGDGLKVGEGIPIFSALTGIPIYTPACVSVPATWPPSPLDTLSACSGTLGAGGSLGTTSPSNFLRVFVSPTLTGGVGTAVCYGAPAIIAGNSNPQGVSPLVPGGNCIVVAKRGDWCEDDGSDGAIATTGFPQLQGFNFEVINGNCSEEGLYDNVILDLKAVEEYLRYQSTGRISAGGVSTIQIAGNQYSKGVSTNFGQEPLFNFNGSGEGTRVGIDFASLKDGDFPDVLEIQNKRVSAFPEFLMDWVTRQIEEFSNGLTTFPGLFLILPSFDGVFEWGDNEASDFDPIFNVSSATSGITLGNKKAQQRVDQLSGKADRVESGVREAYTFISNTPLVTIEQETINISIPWITAEDINKTLAQWNAQLEEWKLALSNAGDDWSGGRTCAPEDTECQQENTLRDNIITDYRGMISSLEKNIEILESYKRLPRDLNRMLNKKEDYLSQILCNIEAISSLMGGWISKNGQRFKTWVELYVMIKSILQSWQVLIDVFIDYETQCHQCKNERSDLLDFEFSLIDAVIPKLPVIEFPTWPDIIIDLHNIRAGINIPLPEFHIEKRPIILPNLPDISFPETPTLGIKFPRLILLPEFEIPELPDLPTLPAISLPDLPPAPTLPKLFSSLSAVIDILKLLTKALCLLKSSPLVPEWRAGDQIAFLTERSGYLDFDFLSLDLPEFSIPFIDAIKVSTYVNFELEADFIVEMARQATLPIHTAGNNFSKILDIDVQGIQSTDIQLDQNIEIGYQPGSITTYLTRELLKISEGDLSEQVTAREFGQDMLQAFSHPHLAGDPRLAPLKNIWENATSITYSQEDRYIQELQEKNQDKFDAVLDVLNTEIIETKHLKNNVKHILDPAGIIQVSGIDTVSGQDYDALLQPHHDAFVDSVKDIFDPNTQDAYQQDLDTEATLLSNKLEGATEVLRNNYLAHIDPELGGHEGNICEQKTSVQTNYRYQYRGLYVVENDISYRLFDYLDEVDGNEVTTAIDADRDGDEDLLYNLAGRVYLKENLSSDPTLDFETGAALEVSDASNPFFDDTSFFEAVNYAREIGENNGYIAISFSPSNPAISQYRIEYETLVDTHLNQVSAQKTTALVDSFVGYQTGTLVQTGSIGSIFADLGYIDTLSADLSGITLRTPVFTNIRDDIAGGTTVTLTKGTQVFAGETQTTLEYQDGGSTVNIQIPAHRHLLLENAITFTGITGDAYIASRETVSVIGEDIRDFLGFPLLDGSRLYRNADFVSGGLQYAEIQYYDGSRLNIDFSEVVEYELYDIGEVDDSYTLTLRQENDFYYARVIGIQNGLESSPSGQILLAPQEASDAIAPTLTLSSLRVPVYQTQIIDLSPSIYENGGIRALKEVRIDNIADFGDHLELVQTPSRIELHVKEFDTLSTRPITITLIDNNDNSTTTSVPFEVYAPIPQISTLSGSTLSGDIGEDLDNEPISLYRYRGGVITALTTTSGATDVATLDGDYNFEAQSVTQTGGVSIEVSGAQIALVDEATGYISNQSIAHSFDVTSSSDTDNVSGYPEINLNNLSGTSVYRQSIRTHGNDAVEFTTDFTGVSEDGVYVRWIADTGYGYYQIPERAAYAPGALVIYRSTDVNKEPLFTLYPDGRLETLNDFYTLEYTGFNTTYISLTLRDEHFNREVAEVLYRVSDGEYVIR